MLLSRQALSHLKLLGIFYETFLTMNQVVTCEGVALIQRKGIKHKRIPVLTHTIHLNWFTKAAFPKKTRVPWALVAAFVYYVW